MSLDLKRNLQWILCSIVVVSALFSNEIVVVAKDINGVVTTIPICVFIAFGSCLLYFAIYRKGLGIPLFSWIYVLLLVGLFVSAFGVGSGGWQRSGWLFFQCFVIFMAVMYLFYVNVNISKDSFADLFFYLFLVLLFALLCLHFGLRIFTLSDLELYSLIIFATPWFIIGLRGRGVYFVLLVAVVVGWQFRHGGMMIIWVVVVVYLGRKMAKGLGKLGLLAGVLALLVSQLPWVHQKNPLSVVNIVEEINSSSLHSDLKVLSTPVYFPFGAGLGHYDRGVRYLGLDRGDGGESGKGGVCNNQYLLLLVEGGVIVSFAFLVLLWNGFSRRLSRDNSEYGSIVAEKSALLGGVLCALFCPVIFSSVGIWLGALLGMIAGQRGFVGFKKVLVKLIVLLVMLLLTIEMVVTISMRFNGKVEGKEKGVSKANSLLSKMVINYFEQRAVVPVYKFPKREKYEKIRLLVEAENFSNYIGVVHPLFVPSASNFWVLAVPEGSAMVEEISYELEVKATDRYVLEIRLFWTGKGMNDLEIEVNNQPFVVKCKVANSWHIIKINRSFRLDKGTCTVRILNMHSDIKVDYWCLQQK